MKIYEQVKTKRDQVVKITCNKCKREIKHAVEYAGQGELILSFGYPSRFDGDMYEGDLCDDCAEKLIQEYGLQKTRAEI